MKIILSLRRHHYVARVSIFLVMVALIAGMVGCGQPTYNLTIASTAGGNVTIPGEGTFTYNEGMVVDLVAEAEEGYHFVNWTGNVDTIANVNTAATTITMHDRYYITANFVDIYDLTISSTEGGSVTTPGEGTFTYNEGTVVDLVAEAQEGYHFVNWTGDVGNIADVKAAVTNITMNGGYSITANFAQYIPMVAAGPFHTVGLRANGTVVAVGMDYYGQCDVGGWTGIIQLAAGGLHTVGLRANGTVVAVGYNYYGQCDVGGWMDIIQVDAGYFHTVGLKDDGTVVAVGDNEYGQCDVGGWTNIIQVTAGRWHTVGLKNDGTAVAVGRHYEGNCDVGGWTDIIQVTAGLFHTVGLKSDGTLVALGSNYYGQCNVGNWTSIMQVAAGDYHTVGVRSGGTVVAAGWNDDGQCDVGDWTDIIQAAAGLFHTVGLKANGTVVAVGDNEYGQCDVGGW